MAEFLKLAGDLVKEKEKAILANPKMFLLNEAQCTRLWRHLGAVYDAFAPSLSYCFSTQQKCLPLYKEFYNLVMRADAIVKKCSQDQTWLKEAIFLGGNRQAFQELSVDLQSSAALLHYVTNSLCRDSEVVVPSNAIAVTIRDDVLDEDFYKDVTSLMRRLEEEQTCFSEEEKHLANHIVERERSRSSVGLPDPDILPFYEVYRQDPIHVRNVGSGTSGIVSEVKWLGLTCAKKEFLNVVSMDAFVKEVSTLVALDHSRIVKLLCTSREKLWPFGRVLRKKDSIRLFCPDPEEKELVEAAIEYIYSRMEMMEAVCSSMKEHLKVAQICHVQCEYLVQKYLEGAQKVNNLVSPVDLWKLYQSKKLHQFSSSMDRLICSMMAVEELVRACGGNGWKITALGVFAALPWTRTYSIFGLYLWKLYWNLFVINHVMHDITARQSNTSLRLLSTSGITSNNLHIQWCRERCNLVFRRITSTGYEDIEEDEFLEADAYRQVEDRKNLLAFLDQKPPENLFAKFLTCCTCFPPDVPMEDGLVIFMKKKLQSTSASLDFESLQFEELHFEAGKTIGMGFQKNVVKCKWFRETVAIALIEGFVSEQTFRHEVEMLARLQHPNVVHFVGCKWDGSQDCGYIVTELMEQDLRRLIERNRQLYSISTFPLLVTVDILLQIVEAMIHLHRSGVIYRDLKPSNILVSPIYPTKFNAQDLDVYYIVKLTDFQTAKMLNSSSQCYTGNPEAFEMPLSSDCIFSTMGVGTKGYQAPELMSKCNGTTEREGYTFSVDVYSFGMTAYHVITGSHPFELMPGREVEQRVLQGERPPLPNVCAHGVKELIKKCWAGNPQDRPCFEQIRKDLWTMKYHEELK